MRARGMLGVARSGAALLLALTACGTTQAGTQTNWLRVCRTDDDCRDGLRCQCGACTLDCRVTSSACGGLPDSTCVPSSDAGPVALCGGQLHPAAGLCLQRCAGGECPSGTACVAGICAPLHEATDVVAVDASIRYQTLVGFGAGIAFNEDEIAGHPASDALYDAMFAESGFSILRLRNRNETTGVDLTGIAEVVEAAEVRLGKAPTLLLNSSSPPSALKANGSTFCSGNVETCTLARAADGGFDYQGFADYWRASLENYAAHGIAPDYISIQNDPDWVPSETEPLEGCRFLPTEGTATVSVNGGDIQVEYAGYAEALAAVEGALSGLAVVPGIAAPDTTTVSATVEFAEQLNASSVDVLAHHMYETDPRSLDSDASLALAALGRTNARPIFQTEIMAEGLDTAILMHEALSTIGAAVYLQNVFVESRGLDTPEHTALISLDEEGFAIEDPYHTMRHYAHDTAPGWVRVAADSDRETVLVTAWVSPNTDAVTVVLVNPEATEATVEIVLGEGQRTSSRVTRTVFAGLERSADLGPLAPNGVLALPGGSVATVAVRK